MGDRLIPVALWPVAGRPQAQLAARSVGQAWPPLNCGRGKACTRHPSIPYAHPQVAAGGRVQQYFDGGGVGRERLGRTGTPGGPRVLGSSEPFLRGEGGERHHACGDLQNMLQHPSRFHIAKCRLRDEITENSNRWSWRGHPQAAGLFLSLNHMHGSVSLRPALVWIVQPLEAVTPACPGDFFIGCP